MAKIYYIDPHMKKKLIDESIRQLLKWNFKTAYESAKGISGFPIDIKTRMSLLMQYYGNLNQTREGKAFKELPKKVELLVNSLNSFKDVKEKL